MKNDSPIDYCSLEEVIHTFTFRPGWLGLRPGWMGLRPGWMA